MNPSLEALRDRLVSGGKAELELPRGHVSFTGEPAPSALINDLETHPHAFVLAALTDRQVDAKIAWRLPQKVAERVGSLRSQMSRTDRRRSGYQRPESLHGGSTGCPALLTDTPAD